MSTMGRCANNEIVAVLITLSGKKFVGRNDCWNPQAECPMEWSDHFDKCKDICGQFYHAEIDACRQAMEHAKGGTLYVFGRLHNCGECAELCRAYGVAEVINMDGSVEKD